MLLRIFMLVCAVWAADPVTATWQQGSVSVVGDHVVVKFVNGETLELGNVHVAPDAGYSFIPKAKLESMPVAAPDATATAAPVAPSVAGPAGPVETPAPNKLQFLFGLDAAPAAGGTVAGLRVLK